MHPPHHPTLLTDEDLTRELATARGEVDRLLAAIFEFTTFAHERPWLHLDDILRDLRAAVVTVATLERLQAAGPM